MKINRAKDLHFMKEIRRSSFSEQVQFAVSRLTKMMSAHFFLWSSPAACALRPLGWEIRLQLVPISSLRSGTACIKLPLSVTDHNFDGQTYRSSTADTKRRKRKNKYSNFSKTTSFTIRNQTHPTSATFIDKDPWELLMEESKRKNQQLQIEKARKQNKVKSMGDDYYFAEGDSISAVGKPKSSKKKRKRNSMIFPNTTNIDPYDPTTFGYIELGTILGPHGVWGEVKLSSTTDFAATRICVEKPTIRHLKLPTRRSPREVLLLQGRAQLKDSIYILKLEGTGSREDANKLKGSTLYAREEEEKPRMEPDEYMISDLVGLDVFLFHDNAKIDALDSSLIGTVNGVVLQEDVTSTGSPVSLGYDFLEISLCRAKDEEQQLVMIPFVPQIVPHVDISEKRCIYINPPKGMLDLTFVRRERVIIKGFLPPAKD